MEKDIPDEYHEGYDAVAGQHEGGQRDGQEAWHILRSVRDHSRRLQVCHAPPLGGWCAVHRQEGVRIRLGSTGRSFRNDDGWRSVIGRQIHDGAATVQPMALAAEAIRSS